MDQASVQPNWMREWIIFALCLGFGGHIALGLILHSPDQWPVTTAGMYGMVFAGGLYVIIQLLRSLYRMVKPSQPQEEDV